jgi:glycosyltransferase involved in cell wall biosynthesis
VRDARELLPLALESIAVQRVDDVEILVSEDGSGDGTAEWLAGAARRDPRLKVIETGGVGPSRARNAAISMARAPLIAFLDADDVWEPGKLVRQIAFLTAEPSTVFSFTDYLHVDPAGGSHGTCFDYWSPPFAGRLPFSYGIVENCEAELLARNTVGTSTVMARTAALRNANGFASSVQSAEDWELWLRLAATGPVACSTMVTTRYLMRPGSHSANRPKRIAALRHILAPYRARTEPAFRRAVRCAEARIAAAEAEVARERGEPWQACLAELRSLGRRPQLRTLKAASGDALRALTPGRAA